MMIIVTITYSITTSLPFILLSAAVIHSHFDQQQKKENNRRIRQRKLLNWKNKEGLCKEGFEIDYDDNWWCNDQLFNNFFLTFSIVASSSSTRTSINKKKRKTMEGLDKESYGIKKQRQDEVNKTIQLEKQWKYQKSM